MTNIFEINKKKIFTLEDAESLLPLVYKLTEDYSRQVKKLINQLEAFPNKQSERAIQVESLINSLIEQWQNKIERLGAKPKGLWLADFDNGSGYFCWKFPETKIKFFHGYNEGFSGRKSLENVSLELQ
ncbi:MAG: DUF2203 domain-containing protein [Bdellovibrionaceae bacterium]|nr:DUF2203 domain-containing protein [Pseudobdellovibrionaceae bacterium]NUM58402.1 DUF2203 domain-containing protein [Pseudobdellovibrionaceae bacterium]